MTPTYDQLLYELNTINSSLDLNKVSQTELWEIKTTLLETLTKMEFVEQGTKHWTHVCSELHNTLHKIKELDGKETEMKWRTTELFNQMRTFYPFPTVKIPQSVIEASKDYEGNDA